MFVEVGSDKGLATAAESAGAECTRDAAGDLPLARLEEEIEALAAHINAGTCRWLELIAEWDQRGGWHDTGCRTCAEWVSWRCAIAPRAAREHVRVAHSLRELPRIAEAFRAGQLSYSKVRALTRVAEPHCEDELLHFARYATAAQLERIVRGYRRVTRQEASRAHERAYLAWHRDEDGSLCRNGRLAAEDGALFLRALEQAQDALADEAWRRAREQREGGSAEPRTQDEGQGKGGSAEPPAPPRPTHVQALAAVAESALASGGAALSGGERYQVVIHADADALTGESSTGGCELADGSSLAGESARRLACDASVIPIREGDGKPLSIGRKRRTIPPALRRALESRDRTCRFPGCERSRFTDGHHIRHWAHGGETSLANLVRLCRYHHRLVHENGYAIEPRPSGDLLFRHPGGWALPVSPRPPKSSPERLTETNVALGQGIHHDTCLHGSGERMHLGWNVEAMYDVIHRRAP
jgi:hypothetical protein